jgi:hypothetical protein
MMKNKPLILISFALAVTFLSCSEKAKNGVIDVESITFSGTVNDTIYLMKGDVYQLQVNTVPAGAPVKLSNTNPDAFRVSPSGEITALAGGLGTVIAIASNGDSWTKSYCKVLVTENVEEIRINQANKTTTLPLEATFDIGSFFTVTPRSAYNKVSSKGVVYKSSHPEYASVHPITGMLTVHTKGLTEITAVATDANRVTSEKLSVYAGYVPTMLIATEWTATASSNLMTPGDASKAIDESLSTYWAPSYGKQPPHYLLIDMKTAQQFNIIYLRRFAIGQYTKDVEYYITESVVDGISYTDSSFTKIGEISFGNEPSNVLLKELSVFPESFTTRYLLVKLINSTDASGLVFISDITLYNM